MKKLIFFHSQTCAKCHQMAGLIRAIEKYKELEVIHVDCTEINEGNQELIEEYKVQSLPVLVLVNGPKVKIHRDIMDLNTLVEYFNNTENAD